MGKQRKIKQALSDTRKRYIIRLVIRCLILIASVFVLMLIAAGYLLNTYGILGLYAGPVLSGVYLLQYALLFVQIAFMHTCFVLITSERQYAKDKQQIAIERAKAIEKANKAKQEGARRSEKRR